MTANKLLVVTVSNKLLVHVVTVSIVQATAQATGGEPDCAGAPVAAQAIARAAHVPAFITLEATCGLS